MKIEEIIKDENWVSARFSKNWKEYALKELTINQLIDIAIKNGRKVEVLEEALNDVITKLDNTKNKFNVGDKVLSSSHFPDIEYYFIAVHPLDKKQCFLFHDNDRNKGVNGVSMHYISNLIKQSKT